MNRKHWTSLGLALGLLAIIAGPARADQNARWWVVPGAQILWPSKELGLDTRALGPGGIVGMKLCPHWGLEARVHYGEHDPADGTVGPGSNILHGEANATYFVAPTERFSPYLTGGLGAVDFSDALDGSEFAWNAGFGFLYHFTPTVSLRVDGRALNFRHPVLGSQDWLENHEVFAGISFGFGGKREGDEDGDGVSDRRDRCPGTPHGTRVDRHGCPIPDREKELYETGRIRLDNVYFDTDKATIKRESHEVLDEVALILNKHDDLKIEIGGHTDFRGTSEYNHQLSHDRAQAVLDYLVEKHNVARSRFTVKGYGESEPIASNDTESGMAKNRRVEFKVLNPEALKR